MALEKKRHFFVFVFFVLTCLNACWNFVFKGAGARYNTGTVVCSFRPRTIPNKYYVVQWNCYRSSVTIPVEQSPLPFNRHFNTTTVEPTPVKSSSRPLKRHPVPLDRHHYRWTVTFILPLNSHLYITVEQSSLSITVEQSILYYRWTVTIILPLNSHHYITVEQSPLPFNSRYYCSTVGYRLHIWLTPFFGEL